MRNAIKYLIQYCIVYPMCILILYILVICNSRMRLMDTGSSIHSFTGVAGWQHKGRCSFRLELIICRRFLNAIRIVYYTSWVLRFRLSHLYHHTYTHTPIGMSRRIILTSCNIPFGKHRRKQRTVSQ